MIVFNDWKNLQNVNEANMKNMQEFMGAVATYYNPEVPCICSGVGTQASSFGQVGTTAVFDIEAGFVRYPNRTIGSSTNALCFVDIPADQITVTGTDATTKYICAELVITQWDTYTYNLTASINPAAKTIAEVLSNDLLLPLFVITSVGVIYSVSSDSNCAYNYNQ